METEPKLSKKEQIELMARKAVDKARAKYARAMIVNEKANATGNRKERRDLKHERGIFKTTKQKTDTLTKSQAKGRAANKAARKARRNNR